MLRLVAYLFPVAIAAWALSWLADRPGTVLINWQGRDVEISVFHAVVMLALLIGLTILLWSLFVQVWRSPASLGAVFNRRRQIRGLDALSSGMIAIGAGDRALATRYAVQARKSLPNEPLTHLLRAQAAQLAGDRTTARRIFEAMLGSPDTQQLGLRGLFLEAEQEGEHEAARQFAERAVALNPKLGWPVDALFDHQCKARDWDAALATLTIARRNQQIDKPQADRRRAVLLTARAQAIEEANPDRAMQLALEAHHLAHDLIPAAAIAGRILAARGHTKRAAHVVERTWRRAPHPDLATVYAHARTGDSPRDRLDRIKRLGPLNQHSIETPIAIATTAIEAREWDVARRQLEPLADDRLTQRVCTLMARVEGEQHGDSGRVREWLARAVHAPRDAAWTADGVVSDSWAPVSPVTGTLDAFQWRVPVSALERTDAAVLAQKLDDLVRLGAHKPHEQAAAKPALERLRPDRVAGSNAAADARSTPVLSSETVAPDVALSPRQQPPAATTGAVTDRATADRRPAPAANRDVPGASTEGSPRQPSAANPADARGRTAARDRAEAPQAIRTTAASVNIEPAGKVAPVVVDAQPAAHTRAKADGPTGETGVRAQTGRDPKVYLPPRAPDDPGLEHADDVGQPRPDVTRGATSSKRSF